MSIRKSTFQLIDHPMTDSDFSAKTRGRRDRVRSSRRRQDRRSLIQALEQRQLLAGPNLIGIQPNEGSLLADGATLNVAPRELVFRFDDSTSIDASTLDGIQITRAGDDQVFESAKATSDLGTGLPILLEFRAVQPGTAGEGLVVRFTTTSRGTSGAPLFTVADSLITIDLNSNPARPTQIRDLISGVEAHPQVSQLLRVFTVAGGSSTPIGTAVPSGKEITLRGANAADATTDLGTSGAVRVRFLSALPGADGRATSVVLQRANAGGPANPLVLVSGNQVTIRVNSNPGNETTAAQLIDAVNNNPEASRILTAILEAGNGSTLVGNRPAIVGTLQLTGAGDIVVRPGFVGLGNSPNEVVFRFAESLPDDIYQIDIFGSGSLALTNTDGEAFNDGQNESRQFRINLGPKVMAVVPEPVRRNADGTLTPVIGVIEVHFNEALNQASAQNPNFYQLIFTRDTASPADDRVVLPTSVSYNRITNIATLTFAGPLARLPDGAGGFLTGAARLRIGNAQTLPAAPTTIAVGVNPGDSFGTAFSIGNLTAIDSSGVRSVMLESEIRNAAPYDLAYPGGPGTSGVRAIRPEDPSRLDRPIPLDFFRTGPDNVNGIQVIQYSFPSTYAGDDPSRPGSDLSKTYFNLISDQQKQRVREVLSLFSEYLGVQFVESPQGPTAGAFFSIAVGDLYGADDRTSSGVGGLAIATRDTNGDGSQDLVVLDFQDFQQSTDDQFGGQFFRGAMLAIGQALGYGFADGLPQPVTQSSDFIFNPGTANEPTFPSVADIVNGQYLYRPESTDIDLYRFRLDLAAFVSIQSVAERLASSSLLDTHLRLFREDPVTGVFVEVAQNDDYFSNDSLIELELSAGNYVIGVSASGNDTYNPVIPGTGLGGRSEGTYELKITTRAIATTGIRDETNVILDGDGDGRPGGVYDFWFVPSDQSNTFYVDKAATLTGNGTIARPFRNIKDAVALATPGTTIRVLPNGGADGRLETLDDNLSYQIGFSQTGSPLEDGTSLDMPQGVRLIIDAGTIIKLRSARIGVGSTTASVNRSDAAIQVLGTPTLINSTGQPARDDAGQLIPGSVIFTSVNDRSVGTGNQSGIAPTPQPGDWGGIDLRGDIDYLDSSRRNRENEGVFLNHIQFADLRFGGGRVSVDGQSVVVSPVEMALTRATVVNSTIRDSGDAAIAATPDTFTETRFDESVFQQNGRFTPTGSRVGPDIHGNLIVDNSINGLFIRVSTRTGDRLQPLTSQARFDDTDIVHVLAENLTIQGAPGGPVAQAAPPSSLLIGLSPLVGDGQVQPGTYVYRLSFASPTSESAASVDTARVTLDEVGRISLTQLPVVAAGSGFTQRRLYRAFVATDGTVGAFVKVADLNGTDTTFVDRAAAGTAPLPNISNPLAARLDASLKIDPGTIVKTAGARIDVTFGANLLAEGTLENRIVFTSIRDQRFGIGGTFDTNSEGQNGFVTNAQGVRVPIDVSGTWGGIYVGHTSLASLDRVTLAGAGGVTRVEGGFASFNPIEVHQGTFRLANSRLENNADGRGLISENDPNRVGRGDNASATVFVRGAQPIIVDNVFINGGGPALSFDVNSLIWEEVIDRGRSTGTLEAVLSTGNSGPLISGNRLGNNSINGMEVRPGQVATEVVFDDVDIVHVVRGSIEIPNQHVYGGLRLESTARGSLVVKFETAEGSAAGIVAGGTLATAVDQFVDIRDRIGGSLRIVGHPDFPVVLTTLADDFAGAGFTPAGLPQVDTNNDGVLDGGLGGESGDGLIRLPTGPEVDNGNLIDNDVDRSTPGFFEALIGVANEVNSSGVTVSTPTGVLIAQDYIFQYSTFVRIGDTTTRLSQTTITQQPTLVSPDRVESRGSFVGPNGAVDWVATSFFLNGTPTLFSTLDLSTATGELGAIQVISYLDEDVEGPIDDLLYTVGTPGQPDFRLFTVDSVRRIGFSHGGFYTDGANQTNATYAGWAADRFNELQTNILNNTQQFAIAGVVNVANLPAGVDPVFGNIFGPGDVTTAHAWDVAATATTARVTSFLELITSDPTQGSPLQRVQSGLWNGLVVREGANDRNVAAFTENELGLTSLSDSNAVPSQAQFLGELAPSATAGDENRRLGFIVEGVITQPQDVDVFAFIAEAGTEVWLDIDRTSLSLDSIVELINANGQTLALSVSSLAESRGDSAILVANGFDPSSARPLNTLPIPSGSPASAYQDAFSTNPRDAGMRVVLPGQVGTRNLYHVRVRSNSQLPGAPASSLLTNLNGMTQGSYQLQIRLRELDEVAGTQVRFADVRYATKGIQVIGHPLHSPLSGDDYETAGDNNSFATAQPLGLFDIAIDANSALTAGPLASDRLAKSVGGMISGATDVDWYRFDVGYQNLTRDDFGLYLATIFDIDYADGFARADLSIYVFNGDGQLVLIGTDSNIADDQPTGLTGTDSSDLSRGSAGTLDPYIGVAELSEGTYFVAITSAAQIASPLDQYFVANPVNPLLRLEPMDSVRRIAEDRIGSSGGGTADAPVVPLLFDPVTSVVPYTLADLILYKLDGDTVDLANPFTGQQYGEIGVVGGAFQDFAFQINGELFAYSLPSTLVNQDLDVAYSYFRIDSATGALTNLGQSGLETFHVAVDAQGNPAVVDSNDGFNVLGMTIVSPTLGFVVGNRPIDRGNAYFQNIVYAFNPQTGEITGLGSPNRQVITVGQVTIDERAQGAGTQIRERGFIETGTGGVVAAGTQLVVPAATDVAADGSTTPRLLDGNGFTIQVGAQPFRIELDAGPILQFATNPAAGQFAIDGTRFTLTTAAGTQLYELDSGPVVTIAPPAIPGGTPVLDGASVVITSQSGVSQRFEFDTNGVVTGGSIGVPVAIGATNVTLASALASAINAANFGVQAAAVPGQGRVDLVGDSRTVAPVTAGQGLGVFGAYGSTDPNIPQSNLIPVRESFTGNELAAAVAATTGGVAAGNRVNYRDVTATNLVNLSAIGVVTQTGAVGVAPGATPVRFLVTDSGEAVAIRIAQAINASISLQGVGVSATTNGRVVQLQGATLSTNNALIDPVFARGGVAPGGLATGLAEVNGTIYAVSSAGGLYRIVSNLQVAVQGQISQYVETATDLLGINFTGLTTGPTNIPGLLDGPDGLTGNPLLFGSTAAGDVYAFDTEGRLRPVFAGGASRINIGPGVRGIEFSTLDFNLWHTTDQRGDDPGHGIDPTPNGARQNRFTRGGTSFYFGASPDHPNIGAGLVGTPFSVPRQDGQPVRSTYNFPGGAKGALESNPISLVGYSSADLPMLYFNYFLETDGFDSVTAGIGDRDAFRVYVITPDGVEHLVATNNLATQPGINAFDDEFDDPRLSPQLASVYNGDIQVPVQRLFDNTDSWRQARVSLSEFAGLDNLRLRVEFSTAGTFSDGQTVGLRTKPASHLVDGATFVVGGETFEIELGPTLVLPTGGEIARFYAENPAGRVTVNVGGFTYLLNDGSRPIDGDVNVPLQQVGDLPLSTFTATQVASRLAEIIRATGLPPVMSSFGLTAEPNDELIDAAPLPTPSGNGVVNVAGNLDRPTDVDLVRFELPAGATINVSASPAVTNAFPARVRLFDQNGVQISASTVTESASFTTNESRTIYIGFSSGSNTDYNPTVANSGSLGVAGDYIATISLLRDLRVLQSGGSLQISGGVSATAGADGLTTVTGSSGTTFGIPVTIDSQMSDTDVARAIQLAVANRFAGGVVAAYPVSGNAISLAGLTIGDVGPFGLFGVRTGDVFGSTGVGRAAENAFEGVYVDDFIIGFAERGELVTGALGDQTDFIADPSIGLTNPPRPPLANTTGAYQLEIRDGSEYVNSLAGSAFRTFDTNDRLASGFVVTALPADQIVDGITFQISDGVSAITFEFDVLRADGTSGGVSPGRVRIPVPHASSIAPGIDSSTLVAAAIIEAINGSTVRSILDVAAVPADGIDSVGSNRINLFGDVAVVQFTGALASATLNEGRGDKNRDRESQGVILIENSRFIFNSDVGVELSHGSTATVDGQTTDSIVTYPRNLVELNTQRLIPGVVVQSNVVAFNQNAGIRVEGLELQGSSRDPVPFDRIVNNTIVGGQINAGPRTPAGTFGGVFFPAGQISFADSVVSYVAGTGVTAPFNNPNRALGAPESTGRGAEPVDGLSTVSLGSGGRLTVEFTDNLLTGSGDGRPDLIVFETGEIESVRVEVSRDGITFLDVGVIGGIDLTVDLDSFGFGIQDRFRFVRLTDLRQGTLTSGPVGADIDAIGALSTVPRDVYVASGDGIVVTNNAAPTLLNNVIANTETGLTIDPTSSVLSIVGGTSFYRNDTNAQSSQTQPLGQFSQQLPAALDLFVDPKNFVFTPRAGVPIIDASIDSLEDRTSLVTVRSAIGLPPSPIIAPRLDVNGQLRVSDPSVDAPFGVGQSVFKDRGAEDRADLVGPRAVLVAPRAPELGMISGQAETRGTVFDAFDIQLIDGIGPVDPVPGVGVDDASVTSGSLILLKDGVPLVEGVDYRFGYNASNNLIRLTPIAGIWEDDSVYVVRLLDASDSVLSFGPGTSLTDGAITSLRTVDGAIVELEADTGIRIAVNANINPVGFGGQAITVFDGTFELTFEVSTTGVAGVGRIPVVVPVDAISDQIAAALASAVNATTLNVQARSVGPALQLLGGSTLSTATPIGPAPSIFTVSGEIGTRIGFGIGIPADGASPAADVLDGQTFTIRRGADLVRTFELDFGGGITTPGAIAVSAGPSPTLDAIAEALVRAIGGAGLGLDPINRGEGRVALGGDANYSLDVTNTGLIQLGFAGQDATTPVTIPLDATAEEVRQAYQDAIAQVPELANVSVAVVGSRLILNGVTAATGENAVPLPGIRDRVGNPLQSNLDSGLTELTIFVGGGFDFGDAPAPYTSLAADGGPRHRIDRGLHLGPTITPKVDAMVPDGDISDDGVFQVGVAQAGGLATFTVDVRSDGRAFYLDVWVDWNGDGIFSAGEKTTLKSPNAVGNFGVINAGVNQISVPVPPTVVSGATFARFRLSEVLGLGPNGDADSGEVEDIRVLVQGNPYQNPLDRFDVNKSGLVTPLDALNVMNLYSQWRRGGGAANGIPLLPLAPNAPIELVNQTLLADVDGNGVVQLIDALQVLNEISRRRRAGVAEGEGESLMFAFDPISTPIVAAPLGESSVDPLGPAPGFTEIAIDIEPSQSAATSANWAFDDHDTSNLDEIIDNLIDDLAANPTEQSDLVDAIFTGF